MIRNIDLMRDAMDICRTRPTADISIEQYLMTAESIATQVSVLEESFHGKKVLYLGDDDHISVLMARYIDCRPFVAEYDARIRHSLRDLYYRYGIEDYDIIKHDARYILPVGVSADAFYINPPYSSKNNGKGARVWLSRVSSAVPVGSTSVLVYPVLEDISWTIECFRDILEFAHRQGFVITNLVRNLHTYEYLPNDPGLLSSNIYLYKYRDIKPIEVEDIGGESLYR